MGGGCSSKTSRQKVSEVDPKQTDLRADKLPREHPHSEEDEEALNPEVKDHDPTMENIEQMFSNVISKEEETGSPGNIYPNVPLYEGKPVTLWEAVDLNDFPLCKQIINSGFVEESDLLKEGHTILHFATRQGYAEILLLLIENFPEVSIDTPNCNLATPLHLAAKYKKEEAAQVLIGLGADPNLEDERGQTPMLLSAIQGDTHMVQLFIESNNKGLFPQSMELEVSDHRGLTALNCACIKGDECLVRLLIEEGGVKVETASPKGCTPLIYATRGSYLGIMEQLISAKGNPNKQDISGSTALHYACEKCSLECIRLLLDNAADFTMVDRANRTPLFECVDSQGVDSLLILIEAGSDVNHLNCFGQTPLFNASRANNLQIIRLLCEMGADPNFYSMGEKPQIGGAKPSDKETKIQMACVNCSLLPLQIACALGFEDTVIYLITQGANPNIQGRRGYSSFHISLICSHLHLARILLNNGADTNIRTTKGKSGEDLLKEMMPELWEEFREMKEEDMLNEEKRWMEKEEVFGIPEQSVEESIDLEQSIMLSNERYELLTQAFSNKIAKHLLSSKWEERARGVKEVVEEVSESLKSGSISELRIIGILHSISQVISDRIHKIIVNVVQLLNNLVESPHILSDPHLREAFIQTFTELNLPSKLLTKAQEALDREKARILDVLEKLAVHPGVGPDYIATYLVRSISPPMKGKGDSPTAKAASVGIDLLQRILITVGLQDTGPLSALHLLPVLLLLSKSSKRQIKEESFTIIQGIREELGDEFEEIVGKLEGEEQVVLSHIEGMEDLKICAQEGSVSIEGAGLENLLDEEKEHPLQDVRDALLQVNDAMDEVFWEISYNIIQKTLLEKNLIHYLEALDTLEILIEKGIEFGYEFMVDFMGVIIQQVVQKTSDPNKRIKNKSTECLMSMWNKSQEIVTSMRGFQLVRSKSVHRILMVFIMDVWLGQKALSGRLILLNNIATSLTNKYKNCDVSEIEVKGSIDAELFRNCEKLLGFSLLDLFQFGIKHIENRNPKIRELSISLLSQLTVLHVEDLFLFPNKSYSESFNQTFITLTQSLKPQLKKELITSIKESGGDFIEEIERGMREEMERNQHIAGGGEDIVLPYAEPLFKEVAESERIINMEKVFSRHLLECIFSQTWSNRVKAIAKIKEEMNNMITSPERNTKYEVNSECSSIAVCFKESITVLRQLIDDKVMKIYSDTLDLMRSLLPLFFIHLDVSTCRSSLTPLLKLIINKLSESKVKVRENSLHFLHFCASVSVLGPEYISHLVVEIREVADAQNTGKIPRNPNLIESCIELLKAIQNNHQLGNNSEPFIHVSLTLCNLGLQMSAPGVRKKAKQYILLLLTNYTPRINKLIGDSPKESYKRIEEVIAEEELKEVSISPKKEVSNSNMSNMMKSSDARENTKPTLSYLISGDSESLLLSEIGSKRVKGLMGVKKYIAREVNSGKLKDISGSELLEETSLIMQKMLCDSAPEVYCESVKVLQFAYTHLIQYVGNLELQLTTSTMLNLVINRQHSTQISVQIISDKFILFLAKHPRIGPGMTISALIRSIYRAMPQGSIRDSGVGLRPKKSRDLTPKQAEDALALSVITVNRELGVLILLIKEFGADIGALKEVYSNLVNLGSDIWTQYERKAGVKERAIEIIQLLMNINNRTFQRIAMNNPVIDEILEHSSHSNNPRIEGEGFCNPMATTASSFAGEGISTNPSSASRTHRPRGGIGRESPVRVFEGEDNIDNMENMENLGNLRRAQTGGVGEEGYLRDVKTISRALPPRHPTIDKDKDKDKKMPSLHSRMAASKNKDTGMFPPIASSGERVPPPPRRGQSEELKEGREIGSRRKIYKEDFPMEENILRKTVTEVSKEEQTAIPEDKLSSKSWRHIKLNPLGGKLPTKELPPVKAVGKLGQGNLSEGGGGHYGDNLWGNNNEKEDAMTKEFDRLLK